MTPEQIWQSSGAEEGSAGLTVTAELQRRDRFLTMLAAVASSLNTAADSDQAMREILPLLGETPDVERTVIHEIVQHEDDWLFSNRYEWLQEERTIRERNPDLQRVSFRQNLPSWMSRLLADEVIQGRPDTQPEADRPFLNRLERRNILAVPVWVNQRLWGMLGLTNNHAERFWNEAEIAIFRTVALNLGSALSRFEQAERLQQKEAMFRALYNHSFQLTGLLSPAGTITDSNETVCQALGMSYDELQGQAIWDLPVWPDQGTRDALRDCVGRAACGEFVRTQFVLRSPEQTIYMDYSLTPILGPGGEVRQLLSEGRDISSQKQAEHTLRERAKEMECLYEISRWADMPGLKLEDYFRKVVELVPAAFLWPERTSACLEIDGQIYRSAGFRSSSICIESPIRSNEQGNAIGQMKVCLSNPEGESGSFAPEERVFLAEVNRILSRIIERVRTRERLIELNFALEDRLSEGDQALKAREALMARLLQSLPDLVFLKDPEGRYLGCNQAFEQFTGKSEAELLGHRDAELFTDAWISDDWAREEWRQVFTVRLPELQAGQSSVREEWIYQRGGPRVYLETRKLPYFNEAGEVLGFIGISRDLTVRKLAENAIQENEAKIRQLIEGVPVGIFVMEASGTSYFANQAALDMLGRGILPSGNAAEQLAPYKSYIAGTDTEYPQEQNPLVRAFVYKEKTEVSDLENQLPDGTRVPLHVRGAPVLDAEGELMYAVAAFSDISEMRRKEAELIDARERAEAASRAKSDFLANMSHEIRTPMNAIIGLNHLLLRTGLTPKQSDHVHKIQSAAQNLLGIINDILDFSKIEAGKLRMERIPFDLNQVIVNLSNLLSVRAQEKGLELLIRLGAEIPSELVGDPLRLEQVLLNLAGNAIKFTEAGEVELVAELLSESPDQLQLGFRVRDTGIGISQEQQQSLFQAFTQADTSTTRRYGGSGLGLSIARRLVELMHGQIGFSSEAGAGSEFYFSAWFGKPEQTKAARQQAVPSELKGLRVLAIDDHPAVLELIQEYLSGFSFELDKAATPAEALGLVSRQLERGQSYDLLLVDWMIPGTDGFTLIERIWELMPERPRTILMTSFGRDDVFTQADTLSLDGLLLKPLTPSLLFDAVIQAFGGSQQLQAITSDEYAESLDPVRGARILLVEDNEINQTVAKELLEAEGFVVELAANGREALNLLSRPDHGVELVLMDIHMPEMDGYTATRRLRERPGFERLPIVAMTADAVTGIREQVLTAGMNDFVTKPIDLKELFGALVRWLPERPDGASRRPARSPSVIELPPLAGIETQEALLRLGGNVGLYIKLLRRFGAELPERLDELAASLGRQDAEGAYRIAHTIKGTAGNLGMTSLQARMASLEQALKGPDWPTAEYVYEQAWQQLQPLLPEISHLKPVAPPERRNVDPARQAELQRALGQALSNYDPSAGDLLQQLTLCTDQPGRCAELEELVDNFDFEAALICWQQLEGVLFGDSAESEEADHE